MDARETGVGSARGTGGEGRRARRRDHIGTTRRRREDARTRGREDAGDARGRDERVDAAKSEREGRLTVKRFDDAR
jgi:hypothetical protein